MLGFFGGYHGNILNWVEPESEMNVDRADIRLARSLTGLVHFQSTYWPMWNMQKVSA